MKSTYMIGVAISAALAFAFCMAPTTTVADTGGTPAQNDADGVDEAEKARQEAIADVKRRMNELQNYNPAKDARLNGLTGEEKKKKYIELVKAHEKEIAELKKNEYYNADDLKTEREAFEEDMGDPDEDIAGDINDMTDEEFEEYLNEADDDGGDEDGEEEENKQETEEEKKDREGFGVPDEVGGDDEDEDKDKEPADGGTEYNYDHEEMAWYKDEGMTKEEIEKERKSLNQKGIDEALKKFSGLKQVLDISMVQNAMSAGADIIKEIPGWDVTNEHLDDLANGFDGLLDLAKKEAMNEVKSSVTGIKKPVSTVWSPSTTPLLSSSSMTTVRASSKASSLLLASDGTVLIDEEPAPEPQPPAEEPAAPMLDDASFADFQWKYGGFKGGDAVFAGGPEAGGGPVISGLRMGRDGLSFKYEEGLSSWGLSRDDAGALACLFVLDNDGEWVGGKFDWISTSRDTRDFENVYGGYEGWDLSNVPRTTTAAFVIVSRDGKKRSNVITSMWER